MLFNPPAQNRSAKVNNPKLSYNFAALLTFVINDLRLCITMDIDLQIGFWEIFILCGLFVFSAGLVIYYLTTYRPVFRYTPPSLNEEKKPVSIILSGKNQYEPLKKNLTFWLEQKYPRFEIVVIYETADEDVTALLRDFARRYDKLKLINANQSINFFDEQKFSLSIGVKSAENEIVILTNARFRPTNENCIDYIQSAFSPDTKMVIGHPVFRTGGRLCSFASYIRLEETLQYISSAIKGKPLTARRELVAYRKSFFLEHRGYSDTYALNSGPFDKLHPHLRSSKEIGIQTHPESEARYTYPYTLGETLKAERQYRNIIASEKIPASSRFALYRWMTFFYFLFLAGGIFWFFKTDSDFSLERIPVWIPVFLFIFLIKFIFQAVWMQKASNSLRNGLLWCFLPFYEILYLPLQVILIGGKNRGR